MEQKDQLIKVEESKNLLIGYKFSGVAIKEPENLQRNQLMIKGAYLYKQKQWKQIQGVLLCIIGLGIPFLLCKWIIKFRIFLFYSKSGIDEATHIYISEQEDNIIVLEHKNFSYKSAELLSTKVFKFKGFTFYWDHQYKQFQAVQSLIGQTEITQAKQQRYSLSTDRELSQQYYGKNQIDIQVDSFLHILIHEILNPFYMFQVLAFIVWILYDYAIMAYTYMVFTTIVLIFTVQQIQQAQSRIYQLAHLKEQVKLITKDQGTITVLSDQLVPGDVVQLEDNTKLTCDCIIINGSVSMNEATLTGESFPVLKNAFNEESINSMESQLYAGTIVERVIQTSVNTLAIVTQTGNISSRGLLLRQLLYPDKTKQQIEVDSYNILLVLIFIALTLYIAAIIALLNNGYTLYNSFIWATNLLSCALPPALPVYLTFANEEAARRLNQQGIFTTIAHKVNIVGSTDIVSFDKTGTLTVNEVQLCGVACTLDNHTIISTLHTNAIQFFKQNQTKESEIIQKIVASCNSLVQINGVLKGDPLEYSMYIQSGYRYQEKQLNILNQVQFVPSLVFSNRETLTILYRFEYQSTLKRMSVVAKTSSSNKIEVYCKGAPDEIIKLCQQESIPNNFEEYLLGLTLQGYRVLAIAYKQIDKQIIEFEGNRRIYEDQLNFMGFLVFNSELKPQTLQTIYQLNSANIKTNMITGDDINTAIYVARECQMINSNEYIYIIDYNHNNQQFSLISSDVTSTTKYEQLNKEQAISYITEYSINSNNNKFAITSSAWNNLLLDNNQQKGFLSQIIDKIVVFARMKPEDKANVVKQYRDKGYTICMCGDGANDIEALNAANFGLSLGSGDASLASSFSTINENPYQIIYLLCEGRAALATFISQFKYICYYSILQGSATYILMSQCMDFVSQQYVLQDLCIMTFLSFLCSQRNSTRILHKTKPYNRLFTIPIFSSIFGLYLLDLIIILILRQFAIEAGVYIIIDLRKTCYGISATTLIFYLVASFLIAKCLIFDIGRPHRQYFYESFPFFTWWITLFLFIASCILYQFPFQKDLIDITDIDISFRYQTFFVIIAAQLLSLAIEKIIIGKFMQK